MAASGEPAVAINVAISGGFVVLVSWDGRGAWPVGGAVDESDDAAESMEGLRTGTVGRVSGRLGRDGGSMVKGEAGGEKPADERAGDETWRSWAYADGLVGVRKPVVEKLGGVGGCAGLAKRMGSGVVW